MNMGIPLRLTSAQKFQLTMAAIGIFTPPIRYSLQDTTRWARVFTIIVMFVFKGQHIQWNHLAAFGCLVLAVFFVFLK